MATAAAKPGVTAARPKAKDDKKDGKSKAPVFPSEFGSHASMINADETAKIVADKQDANDPWSVLTDERGNYVTHKHLLDCGVADPNRFADMPQRDQQLKGLTTT